MRLLPNLPSKMQARYLSLPILAKRPLLIGLYATTAIVVSAHFTAYTYIEPFMVQIGELDPNLATIILLLVFGVSGITASVIFNRLYRFGPTQFISGAMILLAISLTFMLASASYTADVYPCFYLGDWHLLYRTGITNARTTTCPDATDVASAIYSGIFNAGYWCRCTVW